MSMPPPPMPMSPPVDPILFQLGTIAVTQHYVVLPQGSFPIKGSQWTIQNQTFVTQEISIAAWVLAAVLFFVICFFSLFFLLLKEDKVQGFLSVSVTGNGFSHRVDLPPSSVSWAYHCVQQAQALAA